MPRFVGAVTSYGLWVATPGKGTVQAKVGLTGSFVGVDSPGNPTLAAASLEFYSDGTQLPPNSYVDGGPSLITINYWLSALPGVLSVLERSKNPSLDFSSDSGPSGGSATLTAASIAPGSK